MKDKIIKKMIITLCSFCMMISIIVFFLVLNTKNLKEEDMNNVSSLASPINLEQIINQYKTTYGEPIYESNAISEFISLVFVENNQLKSVLIDTNTGKEKKFLDFIKSEHLEDFYHKENELLNLKYPSFIVNGITNSEGTKVYYVKDEEVVIYYYNFTYDYQVEDSIFLKINYHEIKDYITFNPVWSSTYENENGYNYSSDKKTVAITFDDGPSKTYNNEILEILKENKAHATFFMVGSMMESCQLCVYNTKNSGNEIGSHSYEHLNMKTRGLEKTNESLAKTDDIYYNITQEHIKLVRPPYGAYNSTILEGVQYPLILWNLDTEDWRYRDVDHIVNYVIENISDGDIILMHELYETSKEALKILLPKLYSMGYQVTSISELANLQGKEIEIGHAYRSFK